ncbi:MAG TPA: glycoside hydrolase family 38 C-terminal domain-containing protein [Armatimonadota bacterium]|jgi:alpha-mannosidase
MRNRFAAAALFLAAAALCQAAGNAPWRPPARKAYDPAKDKVLYEVGYAHLDTQWEWTYLDTIGTYIPRTMRDNFNLFEKYPNYIFSFTGANRYRMMKEYYPKDYARVKDYVRKNRWHVAGSSWEENDVNVPSSESLIRQFLYGNHYFRNEFGKQSVDFMLPDCFGFPASLPSVLAHCGVKGFSTQKLTWGSAVGIPFTVGRWIGPDGKSITAALDAGSYVSTVDEDLSQSQYILNRINKIGDQSGAYVDYRYFGVGDRGGAPSANTAEWMEKSLKGDGPVTVVAAPADQMFKDLTPQQIAKLPTYKGDLLLTEHSAGSITSEAYMKRWNRKNELLADSAERASVAAAWLGGAPYPTQRLTEAWYLTLGAQFHDILPGTSVPKAYEFSWNDEVAALNHSAAALADGAGAVIRGLDTRAQGVSVVVYNPLSIAREDVVEATVRFAKAPKAVRVYGPNGAEVASQVVGRAGNSVKVLFLAKAPSVGFIAYDVRPAAAPSAIRTGMRVSKSTLENKRYVVTLNADGDVEQIMDKAAGRKMLARPARLALKYEQPSAWPAWNIDWKDQSAPPTGYVSGPARVRVVENGPVRIALEVTRKTGSSTFAQTIRLSANGAGNRVEFDNAIRWNERKTTLKTEFPLDVTNRMATYNLGLGAVERPTNTPRKYEVPSHEWFDLTDESGSYGVSVLEDCKFGSDKPDDHTLRLTLIRTPGAPSYPDQATQDVGHHRVLYALSGHTGDWRGKTPWEATRLNQPLVAFQAPAHPGTLGKQFSLFSTSNNRVAITAIKKAEDSNDTIIRLQELNGKPATVTITAAAPILAAREVDGQERAIGPATLKGGALSVRFSAFNPRAFAVRLGQPKASLSAPVSRPVAIPYNVEAAGFDNRATAKGFDGRGHTFPSELFPASLNVDGVRFQLAKAAPGAKTALACQGQTLRLPAGQYRKVYVLAAAINGDAPTVFKVGARSVPVTVQAWNGFVGQWDNRIWTKPAGSPSLQPFSGGIYGLQPAYIKRDPIAWLARHVHNAKGGNDIYSYAYIFKYAFDVPAGAATMTLPNQPRVRVFAVSAASGVNDAAQPAQYLYDAFDNSNSAPTLSPSAGSFNDTLEVRVQPSIYDATATLRYTTDGSQPTAHSQPSTGLIIVSKTATVRVRAFHGAQPTSPTTSARYTVEDVTPPSITDAVAMAGSDKIYVTFSEALDRASASKAGSYAIDGFSVSAAKPLADGRSVELTVSPAPGADTQLALTAAGVKDTSPNANSAGSSSVTIRAAAPAVTITPDTTDSANVMGSTSSVDGPHGRAFSFRGGSDGVVLADRPELNPTKGITVSAWIRPTDWNGNRRIVQKGNNDDQYRLTAEEGQLVWDVSGVGTVQCALPSVGAWHSVAATYNGEMLVLYVDGVTKAHTAASGLIPPSSDPFYVGTKNRRAADSDRFMGEIADLRMYAQALSPAHIQALAAR